jgi:hypothetical protein
MQAMLPAILVASHYAGHLFALKGWVGTVKVIMSCLPYFNGDSSAGLKKKIIFAKGGYSRVIKSRTPFNLAPSFHV